MSQDVDPSGGSVADHATWQQRTARDELLRSTVRFARLMFDAYACSVFLYRAGDDRLVLEATSEQREDRLLSIEIPAHSGVAGWTFQSGEAMALDNLEEVPQFDRYAAEATGYVPSSMLVAPLAFKGDTFGVVEILDPAPHVRTDMKTLDLLEELARQCCASLAALSQLPTVSTSGGGTDLPGRLLEEIYRTSEDTGQASGELIAALRAVLRAMAATAS